LIKLTAAAADKLEAIIKNSKETMVRVAVMGGGCSGFKYTLNLETKTSESDKIIDEKNIKLILDPKSMLYLLGTEIDFIDSLEGSGFKFINPSAKRTCGCGESFSV
jgi:iron-sulfur cluster assembly protein